ncbi:MAG: hypothetical protein A2255_06030 [Candidatus Melainabacteria bacterium RIFOXYA2_FULL_32_9]|nr:MAG: hypothetical protein A2255_06030 [Candidatus Melainabacteria bacterium RIFOXYA2_FULL_32_9]
MKKNKLITIAIFTVFVVFLLKSCIKADIPEIESKQETSKSLSAAEVKYPGPFKTIEINGVEYKQARGEIGIPGGTLHTSTIGEGPKTFNPWNAKDNTSATIGELMFDGLVSTDAYTGEVIPHLAKSVTVDQSGTVYTIKLRKGLKWSDGKPITAEDVVFTWNDIVAAGLGNTSMRDNSLIDGKMPKVEAIDKLTVKFTTPKPFAPFLRQLGLNIAPKHILEPVVKKGKIAFDSFWGVTTPSEKFVTSGMFRLTKYVPAQRVVFKRNPNYFVIDKKAQKLPYLSNYVIYIVGDLNNEVLKFEAGEIDLLSVRGGNVARFKELEKSSDYKMYNLGPDTSTSFITFNLNRRKNENGHFYVDPKKQLWFNDANFRTAVDYAIDRENIIANILSGVGAPLYTAESLSSVFLNPKLKDGHARDLNVAREYLKKSGFKWDKYGRLMDKWGNIVEINLFTNAGNTEREATGVMVKQDLAEIGIKVNFKPIEFNVLVGKLNDSLDWDAIIIALTGSPIEPHGGRNVWDSSGALHLFNQRKGDQLITKPDLRDWERELDRIFEEGASTIDLEKRKEVYNKYQEIVYNERPLIYIYSGLRIYAVRDKFGNLQPTPLGGIIHNLEEIYIKG